jgi:hypothetical protein
MAEEGKFNKILLCDGFDDKLISCFNIIPYRHRVSMLGVFRKVAASGKGSLLSQCMYSDIV